MSRPRAAYIPELLHLHAQDLAFVWAQRRHALHSAEHTQREFAQLSERVEAHLQGLLCAPAQDLLELLTPALNGDAADESFAAAYALLRSDQTSAVKLVLTTFSQACGPALSGLREALSCAASPATVKTMQDLMDQAPAPVAAAAAAVLASHRLLPAESTRLSGLLEEGDDESIEWAWRAALLADRHSAAQAGTPIQRPYHRALAHAGPQVRDAGWSALAFAGQAGSRPALRKMAADADPVARRWLAVLALPEDVPLLQRCALDLKDGAQRCELLARHGHPGGLNALVRWMDDADEATAVAAGLAFEQITGVDVRGQRRELTAPPQADDFDKDMMPLAWFPDAQKARAVLTQQQAVWAGALRWRRGIRVEPEPSSSEARQLDMQARWDIAARNAMAGGPASPPPLA